MRVDAIKSRVRLGGRDWVAAAVAGALGLLVFTTPGVNAHKAITSKYTYNEDVFPILRDKCGRCHTEGGPAPMSLLTYKDNGGAVAWAESMREMLVSEAMPPWHADPTGPAVRNMHALTPRELDILVTWATGGTPQGDLNRKPAAPPVQPGWALGQPDVTIPMEKAHTLGANASEETVELTLPTNLPEVRWVRAVDLLPGTSSMVRRALVRIENGPVLAVWQPGDDLTPAPGGTAFRMPAGSKLVLQIHYKKPWQDEQQEKSDRSTLGLYFTDEPLSGKDIQAFAIDGPKTEGDPTVPKNFSGTLPRGGRVLALRASVDQPYLSVDVAAVTGAGRRVPLLKLRAARPEWLRRYWLADPIELPAGTRIEVKATPADPDSGPLTAPVHMPLQVALDFVPQ